MAKRGEIVLGDTAKDQITGFSGVVVSIHDYLNGCMRLGIQPTKMKDGKPVDPLVFDIEQLDLVKKAKVQVVKPHGGPRTEPARPALPPR